jgi:hypothetical protein
MGLFLGFRRDPPAGDCMGSFLGFFARSSPRATAWGHSSDFCAILRRATAWGHSSDFCATLPRGTAWGYSSDFCAILPAAVNCTPVVRHEDHRQVAMMAGARGCWCGRPPGGISPPKGARCLRFGTHGISSFSAGCVVRNLARLPPKRIGKSPRGRRGRSACGRWLRTAPVAALPGGETRARSERWLGRTKRARARRRCLAAIPVPCRRSPLTVPATCCGRSPFHAVDRWLCLLDLSRSRRPQPGNGREPNGRHGRATGQGEGYAASRGRRERAMRLQSRHPNEEDAQRPARRLRGPMRLAFRVVLKIVAAALLVASQIFGASAQSDEELRQLYFKRDVGRIEDFARVGDMRGLDWQRPQREQPEQRGRCTQIQEIEPRHKP